MAFQRTDAAGGQGITDVSTTQQHPLGTRIKAQDPDYGDADFVYVKGVASGAAGLCVTYVPHTGVTALTGARSKGQVGVLMAALNPSSSYGWVQVRGTAVVQTAGTVVAGSTVYLTATPGKVDDAVTAGDILYNCNFSTADGTPSSGRALVSLNNPYCGDTDNA